MCVCFETNQILGGMCFLIAANHIVADKKKVEEEVKTAYQKLTDSSEMFQSSSSSEGSVNPVWMWPEFYPLGKFFSTRVCLNFRIEAEMKKTENWVQLFIQQLLRYSSFLSVITANVQCLRFERFLSPILGNQRELTCHFQKYLSAESLHLTLEYAIITRTKNTCSAVSHIHTRQIPQVPAPRIYLFLCTKLFYIVSVFSRNKIKFMRSVQTSYSYQQLHLGYQ